MRPLASMVLVCCLGAPSLGARAQQPPAATVAPQPVPEESTPEAKDRPSREGADQATRKPVAQGAANGEAQPQPPETLDTAQSPEVFVPSENISEDIAVPFPVDI